MIFQVLGTKGEIVKDSAENYFTNCNMKKSDVHEEEEEEVTLIIIWRVLS